MWKSFIVFQGLVDFEEFEVIFTLRGLGFGWEGLRLKSLISSRFSKVLGGLRRKALIFVGFGRIFEDLRLKCSSYFNVRSENFEAFGQLEVKFLDFVWSWKYFRLRS